MKTISLERRTNSVFRDAAVQAELFLNCHLNERRHVLKPEFFGCLFLSSATFVTNFFLSGDYWSGKRKMVSFL